MNTTRNYQQLGYSVAIQALRDFFKGTDKQKKVIIKELKSPWMNFLTDNLAYKMAEKLEKNPEEIKIRFQKALKEEETKCDTQ